MPDPQGIARDGAAPSVTMTTKGRWITDIYKAALAGGKSRAEALAEVNRVLYPDDQGEDQPG